MLVDIQRLATPAKSRGLPDGASSGTRIFRLLDKAASSDHSPGPFITRKITVRICAYSDRISCIQILTQVVAAQVGPYGIRVNCIPPEIILTERNRERIPNAQRDSLKELHPLKRLGTPEDVAGAALFLASDEASWVTGVVLDIAGGAVMV